jgi:hypothetical protein
VERTAAVPVCNETSAWPTATSSACLDSDRRSSDRDRVIRGALVVLALVPSMARAVDEPPPPAPSPGTAAPADVTPELRYKRGKGLFDYGDCNGTLETLSPLSVPGQLQDEREQLDVHRMLGVCDALNDKPKDAEHEFDSLLSIDPRFNLDPFLTPPAAIEIFDRQKESMKAKLDEIQRARDRAKQHADEMQGGVLLERTTVVRDEPLAVSFMPFGLAQAANGETGKAIAVGVVQGVTLASTVVTFWASMAILGQQVNPTQKGDAGTAAAQSEAYSALVYTEVGSAMAFVLAYGYGAGDALWNREDRAVVEKREQKRPLTPEEIQALKKVPASPR